MKSPLKQLLRYYIIVTILKEAFVDSQKVPFFYSITNIAYAQHHSQICFQINTKPSNQHQS